MIVYVGSLALSVALPGAAAAAAAGVVGINGALPDIQARLDSLGDFTPAPISFAADLALAQQVVTAITATIATPGLTPPDISAQLAIMTALIATLTAQITAVNGQLTILTDFVALLATAGVFVYAYSGRADQLGAALTTELASGFPGGTGAAATNAIVLGTTTPATWTAMQSVFKTTP